MRDVIGEAAVVSLLRSASPEDQKSAAVSFMHHEIVESRKQVATPVSSFKTVPLKLNVSPYRGGENEPLSRWFVELDAAMSARQLRDPSQQVLFAMSNLAGRAKSWAYGNHEWAALERMRAVIGEAAVISLLKSASPVEQRNAATSFMHHEIMNSHRQSATPVTTMRVAPLKLDVSPYRGGENEL
uniref:Retrotransposon gag domain-containing protein n=1 Tax=Globisporangium ultimum (strain ATCC 200006 / CBS 805.95 / DAOM BR144) TaxID=431595 RepID=K3XCR5_GLOUD